MTTTNELFAIGLRVTYTGDMCNQPGKGAIVSITPPDEWHRYPRANIILSDGRLVSDYPIEAIKPYDERNGCAHLVLAHPGHYADEYEVAQLHAIRTAHVAQERAKQDEAKAKHEAEVERVKTEYPYLTELGKYPGVAQVAKNVRAILKHKFPGVKFSVRSSNYSGGDSIDVRWTDGPTSKDVDAAVRMFQGGSFDGMTDCYNYESSAFTDAFGSTRYAHSNRDYSDEVVAQAIAEVCPGRTVEEYRAGKLYHTEGDLQHWIGRWIEERAF